MAKLYVAEFKGPVNMGGVLPAVGVPGIATQAVTFTTSAQSAALNENTRLVRVIADAACHLAFGANPTADADDMLLPSNTFEYFFVQPGSKIAAYDGSS
jgi:hypothetical protein